MRTQRLKQAKVEAERDAALYKSHMESEYQKTLKEVRYIFPIKIVKIVGTIRFTDIFSATLSDFLSNEHKFFKLTNIVVIFCIAEESNEQKWKKINNKFCLRVMMKILL